jgi:hypothetical protein
MMIRAYSDEAGAGVAVSRSKRCRALSHRRLLHRRAHRELRLRQSGVAAWLDSLGMLRRYLGILSLQSRGPRRNPGASSYTLTRLSLSLSLSNFTIAAFSVIIDLMRPSS